MDGFSAGGETARRWTLRELRSRVVTMHLYMYIMRVPAMKEHESTPQPALG